MPRRKEKRHDTEESESFDQAHPNEKVVHFGTVRINRMLAPDLIEGDDTSRYSTLAWSNTLQAQRLLPWPERRNLFHRALKCLPNSYKIWHMYLEEYFDYCSSRSLLSKEWKQLNTEFQSALEKLPRMPRIWLMYANALDKQHQVKRTRQVYNWSFRNLPVTQHEKIWKQFSNWALRLQNHNSALHIIPRYLKLNPDFKETFAEFLVNRGLYDEAAKVYKAILDDDGYHSKSGKDKKDFYFQLIDLITDHPDEIKSFDSYQFIRKALELYPNDVGKVWVKLSDYYIRLASFDKAREMLQEAIESVDNAKDFGVIFSAYVKFQEEMITALASQEIRAHYEVVEEDNVDWEIEQRLERMQQLIDRQPYLLLKIAIRKNANQVQPWISLVALHKEKGDMEQAEIVIQEAIQNINPEQAEGKFSDVWLEYLGLLQLKGEIKRCNQIMHKASQVNFKMMEDYLAIWRRWAEFLLQQHYYEDALKVIQHVLFKKKTGGDSKSKQADDALKSHATLWQLYIDLEINLGNFDSTRKAFERCREHRSLTPLMLLNYTKFLWEGAYFEETFRVFEFALSNFKWPSLHQIWIAYISKFINRHGASASGVERSRSMFERLLRQVPKHHAYIFYFMYAQFEEEYGLYSHAVQIYDRMVKAVLPNEKFSAYSVYITKVSKLLGVTKARPVFEHALQNLKESEAIKMGRKYSELESHLGQLDRCRAIYGFISQFCDPRDDMDGLWKEWEAFEVDKGDKESFKEYLRIRRSVQAKFTMLPPDLEKIEEQVKRGMV